jgi:hypothetical protein
MAEEPDMRADPLDQSESTALTLHEWCVIRQAHDLPILTAVRRMLDDVEAGHIAAVERQRHNLPLH